MSYEREQEVLILELPNKTQLDQLFRGIRNLIADRGFISEGDILDLVGLPSVYEDQQYGWTSIEDMKLYLSSRTKNWVIDFPLSKRLWS